MARQVTLFTGQWADLPLEELAAQGSRLGLRRPRARVLGRPLRGRPGARRSRLRRGRSRRCSSEPPELLRDRRPPRRPGRLRPDRRAPPGDPSARGLGRRRPRGRPAARGRADEGHRTRRGRARHHPGQRLHRLVDLAPALLLPAERLRRRSSAATRTSPSAGGRSSTCSTRRACASGSRFTRPRSPTTSSPRRRRSTRSGTATGFGINFDPSHFAHQFLDSAAFVEEFADRIYHVHVKDAKKPLDGRSSLSASTSTSARPSAAGTSSRRATATSTSRSSSARSTGSATRGRSRSSGRIRAWIGSGARRTRSRSSGARTSLPRQWPSTKRCNGAG